MLILRGLVTSVSSVCMYVRGSRARHKHTGPSYKPYCMPSLTVALLLLEWLHDGVYAGRCCRARLPNTNTNTDQLHLHFFFPDG